jgi:cell division protease FtsH
MGGRAAEDVFTGSVSSGAASDIERASRMAFEGVSMFGLGDSDVFVPQTEQGRGRAEIVAARMLREAYAQAKTILEDRRSQVESLADRLVENKLVTHPFEVIS